LNEQSTQPSSHPGAEHEVLDDQLAVACEQIAERLTAARRVEFVTFIDPDTRQFTALTRELVPGPCKGLFLEQKCAACGKRFLFGCDVGSLHQRALHPILGGR
jgi:hypothetical protein